MTMTNKVIFTFWEPRRKVLPYLELCRETWELNLPDDEILLLDYSNINTYLGDDIYDIAVLKRIPLQIQKDAIMVAVLKKYGGIFMDIDTLAFREIHPIIQKLKHTEIVMFNTHCAFLAARADSHVLSLWLNGIQEKLDQLKKEKGTGMEVRWDYLGNSVLTEIMEDIINNLNTAVMAQTKLMDKCFQSFRDLYRHQAWGAAALINVLDRIHSLFLKIRRKLVFGTVCRKYLTALDRIKYGYIAEASYYKTKGMSPVDKYIEYWFDDRLDVNTVIQRNPMVIGLHNSWTPDWYKKLSKKEVLMNNCLLSKTLNYIIGN